MAVPFARYFELEMSVSAFAGTCSLYEADALRVNLFRDEPEGDEGSAWFRAVDFGV